MSTVKDLTSDINVDDLPERTKNDINTKKGKDQSIKDYIESLEARSYAVEKKKKPSFWTGEDKGYKNTTAVVFDYGIFFIGDGDKWKNIWFENLTSIEEEDNANTMNIKTTNNNPYIFHNPSSSSNTQIWKKFSCDVYASITLCPSKPNSNDFVIGILCRPYNGGRRKTKRSKRNKKCKRRTRRS